MKGGGRWIKGGKEGEGREEERKEGMEGQRREDGGMKVGRKG